jgi:hypothetical protein
MFNEATNEQVIFSFSCGLYRRYCDETINGVIRPAYIAFTRAISPVMVWHNDSFSVNVLTVISL